MYFCNQVLQISIFLLYIKIKDVVAISGGSDQQAISSTLPLGGLGCVGGEDHVEERERWKVLKLIKDKNSKKSWI